LNANTEGQTIKTSNYAALNATRLEDRSFIYLAGGNMIYGAMNIDRLS